MSQKITFDLPEESFSLLRQNPDDFAKELLHAALSKWNEQGLISQSKASEIARLPRQDQKILRKKFNKINPCSLYAMPGVIIRT